MHTIPKWMTCVCVWKVALVLWPSALGACVAVSRTCNMQQQTIINKYDSRLFLNAVRFGFLLTSAAGHICTKSQSPIKILHDLKFRAGEKHATFYFRKFLVATNLRGNKKWENFNLIAHAPGRASILISIAREHYTACSWDNRKNSVRFVAAAVGMRWHRTNALITESEVNSEMNRSFFLVGCVLNFCSLN